MKTKPYFLLTLLFAVLAVNVHGQDIKTINIKDLPKEERDAIGLLVGMRSNPVVYGTKLDGLPTRMRVCGTIEEVTFVPISCGVLCWSGTAKIRLTKKIRDYEHEYA